ncbi:N-formylglutamate amidohydrolase [Jannaschia sp. 2305UL9-9]|uniref:N-formylglutamate amidohydrolase n=1 Tax=Jannaschia sp. 2305UL9-9 TaxID=3121638 RepID=UPI003528D455
MARHPFRLHQPKVVTAPVVVASPHSGRTYDWAFMSRTVLDSERIRSSEDAYVDLLLDRVPALGVPVLTAEMPRAFLDLNRAPTELDPAVIEGVPRGAANPRVNSGLGVIPRVVAQGRAIYHGKIPRSEAEARIAAFWHPYHDQLETLLANAQAQFGHGILLDCHSMPHEAIEGTGGAAGTPEIVLGDRFGSSAHGHIVDEVEAVFRGLGFRVARNAPFAGAYMTQQYGKPIRGRHAIQIEIDRALYMDEARIRPNGRFDSIRSLMTEAISQICDLTSGRRGLAAE